MRRGEFGKLVAERHHGSAGVESGREDEGAVSEFDTPYRRTCEPRGPLENELVDAKMVGHDVLDVRPRSG
jgi:hypothetical protein